MGVAARASYRAIATTIAAGAEVLARFPLTPRRWRDAGDRLGRLIGTDRGLARSAPVIWVHAASVGELNAVRPLLARVRDRYPGRLALVTTMTRTGLEIARALPEVHLATLFPIDAPSVVRRFLGQFRLEAFLFTETEIWPVLLEALADADVPAIMVSGRVSAKTARAAPLLRLAFRRALREVTCCMQSADDAARIVALGADPRRVVVAGSLKFDVANGVPPEGIAHLRAALGPDRPCIVAGSTREGEDEALLDAVRTLVERVPDLVMVLAPRHPERLEHVASLVTARGLPLLRYSAVSSDEPPAPVAPGTVVLLDVMGPLAHCYALARVAFVGGTLAPVGGHNVLEAARAGVPVVVGPHTENVRDVVERLVAADGAVQVTSANGLAAQLGRLLTDPLRAVTMGQRAREVAGSGHGALDLHMKVIAARLGVAARDRGESE